MFFHGNFILLLSTAHIQCVYTLHPPVTCMYTLAKVVAISTTVYIDMVVSGRTCIYFWEKYARLSFPMIKIWDFTHMY